jgi:tetratricopeptide (TPR) repeat protein
MRKILFPVLILVCALSSRLNADTGAIFVQVQDSSGQPLKGIKIAVMGKAGSDVSDEMGKARIQLAPQTKSGMFVTLQVISPRSGVRYEILSPTNGRTPVPSFADESDNFVKVILVKLGDKLMLSSNMVVTVIASEIGQSRASETQQPVITYRTIAKRFGLSEDDVEQAIADLKVRATDPYQNGVANMAQGNFAEAAPELKKSLEIRLAQKGVHEREDKDSVFNAAYSLALASYADGEWQDSIKASKTAIEQHPDDPGPPATLGLALCASGDIPKGTQLLRQARDKAIFLFGLYGPYVAAYENNLAGALIGTNDFSEAKQALRHAQIIEDGAFGTESVEVSYTLLFRAALLLAEAQMNQGQTVHSYGVSGDPNSGPQTMQVMSISDLEENERKRTSAEQATIQALNIRMRHLTLPNLLVASAQETLGRVLSHGVDVLGASQCYEAALITRRRLLTDGHPFILSTLNGLGELQLQAGELNLADKTLGEAEAMTQKRYGVDSLEYALALNLMASLRNAQGRRSDARYLLEQSLRIAASLPRTKDSLTLQTSALLDSLDKSEPSAVLGQRSQEVQRQTRAFDISTLCPTGNETPVKMGR